MTPMRSKSLSPVKDQLITPNGSPEKGGLLKLATRQKTLSTTFDHTLQVGFQGLVSLGSGITEGILQQYQVKEEDIEGYERKGRAGGREEIDGQGRLDD